MKASLFILTLLVFGNTVFAQDLTYDGPGKSEVHSFWINAMGIKRSGKIEEGIVIMEAKLVLVKQNAPKYNIADMEAEIKKWKDKLAAKGSVTASPAPATTTQIKSPTSIVNIKDVTITNASPNYAGPAKMYVTNYYKQAEDAKLNIQKQSFSTAQNKIEQMEKSLTQLKAKDPSYNTSPMDLDVINLKSAMETEKFNIEKSAADGENKAANEQVAYKILGELFGMQNLDFRSDEFPLRAMIVQKHQTSLDAYDALATKASTNALEGFRKKNTDFFLSHTNMTLKKMENFIPTATGTDWVEGAYYTLQYHKSLWNAAQKVYPLEADYAAMYQKVSGMADKLGSIENMKGKGKANSVEETKNRKLPTAVIKDAALEKLFIETFNKNLGAEVKGTAIKAILLQSDWTLFRNTISGVITKRARQAAIVYKGTDGKCYLRMGIILNQEYMGNSFVNGWVEDARLGGGEMLCSNVN